MEHYFLLLTSISLLKFPKQSVQVHSYKMFCKDCLQDYEELDQKYFRKACFPVIVELYL